MTDGAKALCVFFFGVARVPVPVSTEAQGKNWVFNLGVSVKYPSGRGKRLRYSPSTIEVKLLLEFNERMGASPRYCG